MEHKFEALSLNYAEIRHFLTRQEQQTTGDFPPLFPNLADNFIPLPLLAESSQEQIKTVREIRRQIGVYLLSTLVSYALGSSGRAVIRVAPFDPKTLQTIEDPWIIGFENPDGQSYRDLENPEEVNRIARLKFTNIGIPFRF